MILFFIFSFLCGVLGLEMERHEDSFTISEENRRFGGLAMAVPKEEADRNGLLNLVNFSCALLNKINKFCEKHDWFRIVVSKQLKLMLENVVGYTRNTLLQNFYVNMKFHEDESEGDELHDDQEDDKLHDLENFFLFTFLQFNRIKTTFFEFIEPKQ